VPTSDAPFVAFIRRTRWGWKARKISMSDTTVTPADDSPLGLSSLARRCSELSPGRLVETLRDDQARRWRGRRPLPAEVYLDAFPAVAGDPDDALALIWGEVLLRYEAGESPRLEEYRVRFPQHADALAMQFELQRHLRPDQSPTLASPPAAAGREPELPRVPGFEVLGELGRGGMGVVFKARQLRLNRLVALKMVWGDSQGDPQRMLRFLLEAELAARLQHPNIVAVHEVITDGGRICLVLEFVDGPSLAQKCGGSPQPPAEAARLVETLAAAVHVAHQHGIIHRDLKPGNVLLTRAFGGGEGTTPRPEAGANWIPKIADFGLAKRAGADSGLTQTGDVLGTPSYLAPEQAEGKPRAVGPAADVYALGAILYELLTGRPPFRGESPMDTVRRVLHEEPPGVRRLRPAVPRDLETVCLKCLRKEPARRYASAAALAEDLRRFQAGESVVARPVGTAERTWRWARRNPGWAAMFAAVAALLTVIAAVSVSFNVRFAREERARKKELFHVYVNEARADRNSRRIGQRTRSLAAVAKARAIARELDLPPEELSDLRNAAIAALAVPDLQPAEWACQPADAGWKQNSFDIDRSFRHYAVSSQKGPISIRRAGADPTSDEELIRLEGLGAACSTLWSSDGRFVALVANSGRYQVWKLEPGAREPSLLLEERAGGLLFDFTADCRYFFNLNSDGSFRLHDLESRAVTERRWAAGGRILAAAAHPRLPHLALATSAGVDVMDWTTGQRLARLPQEDRRYIYQVAWHPGGEMLAVANDGQVQLWDVAGRQRLSLLPHEEGGLHVDFNQAGDLLAAAGWNGRLKLWDTHTWRELFSTAECSGGWPRFGPDDRLSVIFPDSTDGRRWRLSQFIPSREYQTLVVRSPAGDLKHVGGAAVHPDGRLLAVGTDQGVGLLDLSSGRQLAFLPVGACYFPGFGPSDTLLTLSPRTGFQGWPFRAGEGAAGLTRLGRAKTVPVRPAVSYFVQSKDGAVIAATVASVEGDGVVVWHRDRPSELKRLRPHYDCRQVAVRPDGSLVATSSHWGTDIKVWNADTGELVKTLPDDGTSPQLVFSPDGRWLLSSRGKRWDTNTWEEGPNHPVGAAAFSPDGKVLAVAPKKGEIRLYDFAAGRELARLDDPHQDGADRLLFTPDGARLLVASNDGSCVHVWNLWLIRERLAELNLAWDLPFPAGPLPAPDPPGELPRWEVDASLFLPSAQAAALYGTAIALQPLNPVAYYRRALAFAALNMPNEADADLKQAIALHPDWRLLIARTPAWPIELNNLAWALVRSRPTSGEEGIGVALAERAVQGDDANSALLNTLGVAYYRAGRYRDAISSLEKSLKEGADQWDAFNLYFLAMCHQRLGATGEAWARLDDAVRWERDHGDKLSPDHKEELKAFRAEAEAVLRDAARP
jgi:WD40 repeat protein